MPTLFELCGDFLDLWSYISFMLPENEEEAAKVYSELYEDAVDNLKLQFGEKLEGYLHIAKRLEAEIEAAKKEEARVTAIRKAAENKRKRMLDAVLTAMQDLGIEEAKTTKFKVRVQNSPKAVYVADGVTLPPEYYKEPKTPEIDKKMLLADLKSGIFSEDENVYITQGQHLRVT